MNDSSIFTLERGSAPLLISIPHRGTQIPCALADEMTPIAKRTEDCDWHLEKLYAFARGLGASILTPTYARYVIDLNRPPDDASLYPGRDTTGLCPIDTFDKAPLYKPGHEPSREQIDARRAMYWQPYHDALAGEIDALRHAHGRVLLWEAHSIRSVVPRFSMAACPISTSARRTARRRRRALPSTSRESSSATDVTRRSRTDASRAATSRAAMAARRRACTRFNWN